MRRRVSVNQSIKTESELLHLVNKIDRSIEFYFFLRMEEEPGYSYKRHNIRVKLFTPSKYFTNTFHVDST